MEDARAASWYLAADQATSSDWNNVADWWSAPNGTGTHPASINSGDTFYANGRLVRTPQTTVNETFAGGTLVLNGGTVVNKSKGSGTVVTIPNLVSDGGTTRSISNGVTTINVSIGSLAVPDFEITSFANGGSGKTATIGVGSLSGNGDLVFGGSGSTLLSIASSPQYYGAVYVKDGGTLTLQNAFVSKGAFYIADTSKVVLNQNITVSKLVVGGTADSVTGLWVGGATLASNTTYTAAQLQAAYPAFFTGGTGSITVTQDSIAVDASNVVDYVGEGQLAACVGAADFWTTSSKFCKGIREVNLHVLRTNVLPSKGYTLHDMDIRVAQILNTGAVPLFIQGITKPAPPYTTAQQSFHDKLLDLNGNAGTGGTPATNMAFLVNRYKAAPYNLTTQYWEVGNEPDISIDYQVASPQEYIDIYQSCHNQLVASGLRGNVKLCGPVVAQEYGFAANGNRTDNILNAFLAACASPLNGFNQLDVLTRHVYAAVYSWETSPSTPDTAYNLLNAACEQVTFTHNAVPSKPYRGEYALQAQLRSLGYPASVGTGVTEMNVPAYEGTITQGLWFLVFDHFGLYNPRNILSNGFLFTNNGVGDGEHGYYNADGSKGYAYWATYIHGNLTGSDILAQNSSDPHLLVTATKDDTYVYLQVINRNVADMTAAVSIGNAPVAASAKATLFELTATATPDVGTATALGTSFTYTFPAMTARVFRYLRSDAPAPVTPPPPPATVVFDTSFDSAPSGLQTYYTGFQPVVTGGNLKLTQNTANMTAAAVFNGQALSASRKRMQARFGYRIDSGHAGTGFVFAAYSANPGTAGGAGAGLGFYNQPNVLMGVKIQNKGSEPDQIAIVPNSADSVVDGWVTQPLSPYPWGYAMDMYVVVDYDGDAGTVRARLYQGTDDATGTLAADITNYLGVPATLPAGTVFGFTASTGSFSETTLIQNLRILADNGMLPPAITSAAAANGTAGQPFNYQITATNAPSSYAASGLPSGLAVNTATGLISGTPSASGTFNVTLSATNSAGTGTLPLALSVAPAGSLPAPWVHQNIGTFTPAGTSSYSGGTFSETTGNGLALMDAYTADAFTYVSQPASGDCSITARVASLSCGDGIKGEGGVMIRETSASNSPFALIGVTTGRGLQFSRRTAAGAANTSTAGPSGVAPQWVRITRVGDTFTAYRSLDNVTWTQVGTPQTIAMGTSVNIGLALCNHGGTGTAGFDNVTVTP